ncbi:MAG: DUF418 domain-containing protein [Planctomycetota bacterium]
MTLSPTPARERIALVDALRGLALFGIPLVNLTWFSGYAVASASARADLWTPQGDKAAAWLIHFAVEGKFYSLFALLFGLGYAMQTARPTATATPHWFARRMLVLLALGLAHAALVWFGDIVSIYAVLALGLPWLRALSTRALITVALVGALAPIAVRFGWLAVDRALGIDHGAGDPGHGPAQLLGVFAAGRYPDVLHANWAFLKERWQLLLYTGRPAQILGMFAAGILTQRLGLLADPSRHAPLLRRLLWCGLLVGIPANAGFAMLAEAVPDRPPSLLACLRAALLAVGAPALCVAYAAGFALLWRWVGGCWLWPLTVCGRMSLTNYLGQSMVGVAVFYGCGLGWWGRVGALPMVALAVVLFAAQAVGSAWWLRSVPQGPVESVWRRLTYGHWRASSDQDRHSVVGRG